MTNENKPNKRILFLDDFYATPEYAKEIERELFFEGITNTKLDPVKSLGEAMDMYKSQKYDLIASDFNVIRGDYQPIEKIPESELKKINEETLYYENQEDVKRYSKFANNMIPDVVETLKECVRNCKDYNSHDYDSHIETLGFLGDEHYKDWPMRCRNRNFGSKNLKKTLDKIYTKIVNPSDGISSIPLLYQAKKDKIPFSLVTSIHDNETIPLIYTFDILTPEEIAIESIFNILIPPIELDSTPMIESVTNKYRDKINSRFWGKNIGGKDPKDWAKTIRRSMRRYEGLENKLEGSKEKLK